MFQEAPPQLSAEISAQTLAEAFEPVTALTSECKPSQSWPRTRRDVFEPVTALTSECKVRLSDDSLDVVKDDVVNTHMVNVHLDASVFTSYEATDGVFGIDVEDLAGVAGVSSGDVSMELSREQETLTIDFDGLSCVLDLLDPDSIRNPPAGDIDVEYTTRVSSRGAHLTEMIEAASREADALRFTTDGDEDVLSIEADDGVYGEVGLSYEEVGLSDEGGAMSVETFGPARTTCSLDILSNIADTIPPQATVEVSVGDDVPLKLEFNIAGGGGHVTFFQTPRLTNN